MNIFLKMNNYLTSDAGQKVIGSSLSGLSSALQMFGTLHGASKYDNSANDLYNMLLQYATNIGGISTNMRQETNVGDVISDARSQNGTTIMSGATSGLTAGAAFGGLPGAVVGTVVGTVLGKRANDARERTARNAAETANQKTGIYNDVASNDSRSLLAQINLRMKYGDNEALNLYLTSRGKDSGSTKFSGLYSNKVYTPVGKIPGVANARVAGGEPILQNTDDPQNAVGTVVRDGKYGQDGPLANLGPNTTVLGKDKDWRDGVSFMKKGKPLTEKLEWINKIEQKESKNDTYLARHTKNVQNSELAKLKTDVSSKLNDLVEQLKYQHVIENYQPAIGAARGKDSLPGFRDGYISGISNLGAAAFNTLIGANQYFSAKGDSLYKPEIYAANPYGRLALNTLAGLNVSLYPIIQQLGNVYTNANYATQHSGGLSGALKYVSRVANANNMYNTIATTLPSIQEANNKYKTAFANAAMEIGNQDATRRQQANQFAEESFARAHAARQKAMETGLHNISNSLQKFAANEFKRQLANYMLDLYRLRNKADLDEINSKQNNSNDSFWKNPQDLKLTNPFQGPLTIDYKERSNPLLMEDIKKRTYDKVDPGYGIWGDMRNMSPWIWNKFGEYHSMSPFHYYFND